MKYLAKMHYKGTRSRTCHLTIQHEGQSVPLVHREHLVEYVHGLRSFTVVVEELFDASLRAYSRSRTAPVSTAPEWRSDAEELVARKLCPALKPATSREAPKQ